MFRTAKSQSWLKRIKSQLGMKPARRRGLSASMQGESLESRELMTLNPSVNFSVNTTRPNYQEHSANASSANGMSVAVWAHRNGGDYSTNMDIRGQLYNADGSKRGGEFTVANSTRPEDFPSVAMDARGNFVVVWVDQYSSDSDVMAQRFSANGGRVGGVITIANERANEYSPDVAMAADGRFIVSYTRRFNRGVGDEDVMAKRFSSTGNLAQTITVAASTQNEGQSAVAVAADGRFAIAYTRNFKVGFTDDYDVYLRRYSANGSLVNTHSIANSNHNELDPDVGMDDSGNCVVVWTFSNVDTDVKLRTVSSTGTVGSIRSVSATSTGERYPQVAMDRSDGDFVVAYYYGDGGDSGSLYAAEFSNTGVLQRDQYVGSARNYTGCAISIDGRDNYFITFTSPYNSATATDIKGRFGHL